MLFSACCLCDPDLDNWRKMDGGIDKNIYEITGLSTLIQHCCKTQEKRSPGYDIFYLHVTEHGSRKQSGDGKGLAGNP